jgi:hypothetical protein
MTEDIQARARRWLAEFDGYADEDVLLALAEPLIRDLLAAVETRQWQPIATAPKDGTRVLVRFATGCEVASYRSSTVGEPQWRTHTSYEWRTSGGQWASPTHWMPLPAPPESAR